ncbi:hypothetical protein COOONC_22377 [Cooperia oncophora]
MYMIWASIYGAWVNLLCDSTADTATLQVLGSITHIAFIHDPVNLLGIPEIIYGLYQQMLTSWRENSRGILSMFTAEQAPPPLIASNMYGVSPWATYLLLLVESKSYPVFYQHLYETLVKKDKTTVEQGREASKSSILLPLPRIAVYRWAEFIPICKDSTVFPLAVQRLATESYRLKTVNGLAKAVNGWLFCSHEVTRKGFDFSVFDLDYLLQLILADDKNIWLDFVDRNKLTQEEQQEEKLFSLTCHLGPRDPSQHISDHFLNKPRNSRAIGFPVLPAHRSLPPAPVVDMSAIFHVNTIMEMINPLIKHIRTISDESSIQGVMQQIPVQLRCGIRCTNPFNTAVQVTTTKFNEAADAQMAQSREKRNTILGELHTGVLDRTAIASATMEHIARQLARLSVLCSPSHRGGAQMSGRAMLKTVTSSVTGTEMLFPAASAAYENTLRVLAEVSEHWEFGFRRIRRRCR